MNSKSYVWVSISRSPEVCCSIKIFQLLTFDLLFNFAFDIIDKCRNCNFCKMLMSRKLVARVELVYHSSKPGLSTVESGSMSLARQELVSAFCSFEENERHYYLLHKSSITDVCPSSQEVFCPFPCLDLLLLAHCTCKSFSGCVLLRWLIKFDVSESFGATVA